MGTRGIRLCIAKGSKTCLAVGDRGEGIQQIPVDRARRSSLVTISTSPASSWSSALRSWLRSILAPLAVSRNTFLQPALVSWRTCASTLWPSVETRAYPYFMLLICTSLAHQKVLCFQCLNFGALFLINAQ